MARTSEAQIIYTPRPDATPECEKSALAAVYKFLIFESSASRRTAQLGGSDDTPSVVNTKVVSHVEQWPN
jgi:hypothetical protein